MATNFVQGAVDTFQVAAPHAVVSGRVVVVGTNLFGVALSNADSAAAGASAYWDNTNSQITLSATSNTKIGVFAAAVSNTDTTATVILNNAAL